MRLPDALVERLGRVRSVGVITGAGVSAESGIATYRGPGGIYEDPEEGDRTVDALTGATLARDPDRTWRALAKLARQSRDARPNPAHLAIVEMERRAERFVLLTQNVDGLHQAAGSRNVIDIHGTIDETECMTCAAPGRMDASTLASLQAAPRCKGCGGTLRPRVVLFGEMLPVDKVARLTQEFHEQQPDVVIVAGTSALFPYIAAPAVSARFAVEVNPERTVLSDHVAFFVEARAGDALPLIAQAVTSRGETSPLTGPPRPPWSGPRT